MWIAFCNQVIWCYQEACWTFQWVLHTHGLPHLRFITNDSKIHGRTFIETSMTTDHVMRIALPGSKTELNISISLLILTGRFTIFWLWLRGAQEEMIPMLGSWQEEKRNGWSRYSYSSWPAMKQNWMTITFRYTSKLYTITCNNIGSNNMLHVAMHCTLCLYSIGGSGK